MRGKDTSLLDMALTPIGMAMAEKTAALRQRRAGDTRRWRERLAHGHACYMVEVDGTTFDLMERSHLDSLRDTLVESAHQ